MRLKPIPRIMVMVNDRTIKEKNLKNEIETKENDFIFFNDSSIKEKNLKNEIETCEFSNHSGRSIDRSKRRISRMRLKRN